MKPEPEEVRLAARARRGDREALAELVERARVRLFALAYAELRHYEDAQDAVASALLQICRHAGNLRDPATARAWMQSIVRNEVRQMRRRPNLASAPLQEADAAPAAEDAALLRLDIERALRQMPREQARALALFYLSSLPAAEIARQTGRPEGTIRRWLHQGRRRLAIEMKGYAPMTPETTATILGTDFDPQLLQTLKTALHAAGWSRVNALTDIRDLGALYRIENRSGEAVATGTDAEGEARLLGERQDVRFSPLLAGSDFILLDEWIAGRSAFELFTILRATPEGKKTHFCLLLAEPPADSSVFAAWITGFDICLTKTNSAESFQHIFTLCRKSRKTPE
jgi:RNA polymerase sigma-70 factor (ECF subfamily)